MLLTSHSSFSMVADACYKYYSQRSRDSPSTPYLERTIRVHMKPYWGSTSIGTITKQDVLKYRESLREYGLAVQTIYTIMQYLNHIFVFAMQNHLILSNPCSEIKTPYGKLAMPERRFTDNEVVRLKAAFPKCTIPKLLDVALSSGIPMGELAVLQKQDIHYDTGEISIARQMVLRMGRSQIIDCKRPRTIAPPASAFQQITEAAQDSGNYVFAYKNGTSYDFIAYTTISTALDKIRLESGIPDIKRQSFQDNFIVRCLDAGVDFVSLENYYGFPVGSCISRAYYFRTHPESL